MKMHEHVTCKYKCIMGSAQSKPTNTHHSNRVNTHLKCMKHCYNAHVILKNWAKTSLILKNLKTFQKSQKLGHKMWNAWWREGLRTLLVKKSKIEVEEHLGMKFGVSERCLGGEKTQISWERSKRIDLKLRGTYV